VSDENVSLVAEFYIRAVENEFQSDLQQRPVFEDKTFIKKWSPGDRTTVIDRPIVESDKKEFPIQWAAFMNNEQQMMSGVPVDVWHEVTPSQKAEMNAMGFRTVESIAQASDAQVQSMGPAGNSLRIKAQRFLNSEEKRGPGRPRKELEAA
jgi:hypothetical protein